MANLKQIPDELKIKTYDLIVEKYHKDGTLSEFGSEVQTILLTLRDLYK